VAKKTRLEKDFESILQILEQTDCEDVGDGVFGCLKEAMQDFANDTSLAILCDVVKRTIVSLDMIYRFVVIPKSQNNFVFKQILESHRTISSKTVNTVANK